MPSIDQEIKDISMKAPHLVILGAGASLSACLKGDRYGYVLPTMENLGDILDLKSIFGQYKINYSSQNFEELYSMLYERDKKSSLLALVENKVKDYFSKLSLPSQPTLYDHLVLSLRSKDLIATFNWDPFLYNACYRNHRKASLPHVVYLHGNVAIGYCLEDKIKGCIFTKCSKCGKTLTPSKLLFPITQKNYTEDPFIKGEWETLKSFLKHAYILTIFGYSAPTSDVEAIDLMKEAWGPSKKRNLEEIEIIDIKDKNVLENTWKDFIHTHHYRTTSNFYRSFIAEHPRRSCEAMWSSLMNCDPYHDNNIPSDFDFDNLYKWYEPLFKSEN